MEEIEMVETAIRGIKDSEGINKEEIWKGIIQKFAQLEDVISELIREHGGSGETHFSAYAVEAVKWGAGYTGGKPPTTKLQPLETIPFLTWPKLHDIPFHLQRKQSYHIFTVDCTRGDTSDAENPTRLENVIQPHTNTSKCAMGQKTQNAKLGRQGTNAHL